MVIPKSFDSELRIETRRDFIGLGLTQVRIEEQFWSRLAKRSQST